MHRCTDMQTDRQTVALSPSCTHTHTHTLNLKMLASTRPELPSCRTAWYRSRAHSGHSNRPAAASAAAAAAGHRDVRRILREI